MVDFADAFLKGWGGGGGSDSSTSCEGVVERGGFGPHNLPGVESGLSCVAVPRVSCRGSFSFDSFKLYVCGILHQ